MPKTMRHRKRSEAGPYANSNENTPVISFRTTPEIKDVLETASIDRDIFKNHLLDLIVTEWLIREGYLTIDGKVIQK